MIAFDDTRLDVAKVAGPWAAPVPARQLPKLWRAWLRLACLSFALLHATATFAAEPAKPDAAAAIKKSDLEFFEKKIRPVLVAHCYECHSAKSKIVQGSLYLDTREGTRRGGDSGPAVVPGEIDRSPLIAALRYEDLEMPPKGKLAEAVIDDFIKWVEMGAPDPRDGKSATPKTIDLVEGRKHWAFQPPRQVPPPKLKDAAWPAGEIDRYVLAALEAKGLRPAADAEPESLVRRLYFDLIGLPPTPQDVAEFVADTSSTAYEKLVDKLLASPQFGERWGRHWLDVARYAESSGKERNVPYRMAWRYRDYVIDAFNADMPYDQFVREQLAGDLLPAETTSDRDRQLIATGFLTIGPQALTERVPEQFRLDNADEQLDAVCRAFLASTAACARCHDHKFDPIPTTDYYALIGIFRSTEIVGGVRSLRREFSYTHAVPLGDERQLAAARELQDLIGRLEKETDQARDAIRDANKTKDPAKIELAKQQEADGMRRLGEARARAESTDPGALRFAMAVRDREQPTDYAVRIRGEVGDLGPVVPRGFLSVITDDNSPAVDRRRSGRLELARWIASGDNPLTARVMVNRLWQHLFGGGLVESTDNFGLTGDKPSHPELLDYLATQFVAEGWSVKQAIREMVLSRTYRQSGAFDASAYAVDPGNRLLWRFGRRRLEAETIRDAVLAASGRLDLNRPPASTSLTINNIELYSTARTLSIDDTPRHRAVYLPMLRNNVPEMLSLFDMPDPSLVAGRREVTSVATQSLYLMNSPFVMEQSRRLAERLLAEATTDDARIELAFRLTLGRLPQSEERSSIVKYVGENASARDARAELEAWAAVGQALFCSAEFLYVQ